MDPAGEKINCMNNLCTKEGLKLCTRCRAACYCSKECQEDHWRRHKKCCNIISSSSPEMRLRHFKAVNGYKIGMNQRERGEYDQALLSFQESLEIFKEFENDLGISDCYYQIGVVLNNKKQYEEALVNYRKTLEILRKHRGENHRQTCCCYEAIGNVLSDQGRYDDALIGYGKALAIRLNLIGEQHPETANTYFNIGISQLKKGDYDGALISLEKAKAIFTRELGVQHPKTAKTNLYIDLCQQFIIDRSNKAVQL